MPVHVYTCLFNVILDTGRIPKVWTERFIVPIYKNKGDTGNPDNSRGITLLSYTGKLFTSCLTNVLMIF